MMARGQSGIKTEVLSTRNISGMGNGTANAVICLIFLSHTHPNYYHSKKHRHVAGGFFPPVTYVYIFCVSEPEHDDQVVNQPEEHNDKY